MDKRFVTAQTDGHKEPAKAVNIHCTFARDGGIVFEQSEMVEAAHSLADLIDRVRRFEDDDVSLSEIRITFDA